MRPWPAIIAAALALGALPGGAAVQTATPPAFRDIAWPFPRDGWPAGRAFRCEQGSCRGIEVYIRPKLGFCNCDGGVADDDEVDRVADLDLISERFAPLQPGEPIQVAAMQGRLRVYEMHMPGQARHVAIGIAVSHRCDLLVAVAQGAREAGEVREAATALLESDDVRRWVQSAMQVR